MTLLDYGLASPALQWPGAIEDGDSVPLTSEKRGNCVSAAGQVGMRKTSHCNTFIKAIHYLTVSLEVCGRKGPGKHQPEATNAIFIIVGAY